MEWVETTGRTLDEARDAALDELGVDAADAEFEIVTEPKLGLFGRVRTEGRVRARVRPSIPRPKDDRRDRRRRSGRSRADAAGAEPSGPETAPPEDRSGGSDAVDADPSGEAGASSGAGSSGARRGGRRSGSRRTAATSSAPDAPTVDAGSPADTGSPTDGGSRTDGDSPTDGAERPVGRRNPSRRAPTSRDQPVDRGARTESGPGEQSQAEDAPPRTEPAGRRHHRDEPEEPTVDVALEEQAAVAEEFLSGLLVSFGLDGTVASTQPDDDTLELGLTGSDLGLLIGPKGATLAALQELTRAAVQRRTGAGNGRIYVDVSGYRQQRNAALARFARKIAADALASGQRIALEPMSAADRKVVHDALNDVEGVSTISQGEDAERHVVVVPAS